MIAAFEDRLHSPTERRLSRRERDDFGVVMRDGPSSREARCVEVSAEGLLVDCARTPGREGILLEIELRLPERLHPLTARARPVWCSGTQQALRIVEMSDVDRLSYAERLDLVMRRGGGQLLHG